MSTGPGAPGGHGGKIASDGSTSVACPPTGFSWAAVTPIAWAHRQGHTRVIPGQVDDPSRILRARPVADRLLGTPLGDPVGRRTSGRGGVGPPPAADRPPLAVLLGHGSLQVYDISEPEAPVYQSTYATPGRALRVTLHGNHAFVADGLEGLLVMDLENPSAPRVAGSFKPTESVSDVAVADSLALVAVGPLPTGIGRSQGGGEVLIFAAASAKLGRTESTVALRQILPSHGP